MVGWMDLDVGRVVGWLAGCVISWMVGWVVGWLLEPLWLQAAAPWQAGTLV